MLSGMATARTMLYRIVDGVFVVMHTAEAPHDEEWAQHCHDVARELERIRGVLVYSHGGGPTSKQRGVLRGIVTSINWFLNNRLAAFDPNDLDKALKHIAGNGPPLPSANIAAALHVLGKELSVTLPTWGR
jgi:hypothetical protein